MKKIAFKLVIIIFTSFIIKSCLVEAREIERRYQIINDSQSDIRIKFFNTYSGDSLEVEIQKNEIYLGELLIHRSGNPQLSRDNSFYPSSAFNRSDSSVIIFDNKRISSKSYTMTTPRKAAFSEPLDRNIFRHKNYEHIGDGNYVFVIIESDYLDAVECNGECN